MLGIFHSWQVLLGITIVLFSISTLLSRTLMKENSSRPIAYAILFQLIIGVIIAVVGYVQGQMNFSNFISVWPNLLFTTILYMVFNLLTFNAIKITEASLFTIVLSSRVFFTIIASSFFLNQSLSGMQFVGAGCIFLGIIIANITRKKKFTFGKGEVLALGAAIVFGLANTNDKYILSHVALYPYIAFNFLAPAVGLVVIFPKEVPYMKQFFQKNVFIKLTTLSIIYALSSIAFFAGLQLSSNVSQFITLNLLTVIVTVILAVIFLKEHNDVWKKILGAIVAFVGLLLLG